MNPALVFPLLRQRLGSPFRVVLLLMLSLPPLAVVAFTRALAPVHGSALGLALVFAAGAIGQDVSSGVLHLTFARPVTRPAYVLGRWAAAAGAATALSWTLLVLATAIAAARGAAPGVGEIAGVALESALVASAAVAVMLAFSSLANGLGDLALYAMCFFSLQVLGMVASSRNWAVALRVVEELQHTLSPEPAILSWFVAHGPVPWSGLLGALATTALGLGVAIAVVNRKELSYAAG